MVNNHREIALQFMSKKQLADYYGVSVRTLSRWLRRGDLQRRLEYFGYTLTSHLFTLRQVLMIFDEIGYDEKYGFIQRGYIKYVPVRPYFKRELASFYGITLVTLNRFVQFIPVQITPFVRFDYGFKQMLTIKEVAHVFKYLGHPFCYSAIPIEAIPKTEQAAREEAQVAIDQGFLSPSQFYDELKAQVERQVTYRTLQAVSNAFDKAKKGEW